MGRSLIILLLQCLGPAAALSLGSLRPTRAPVCRAGRITAGWGPDPVWSSLKVASIKDADADGVLKAISVEVPAETAEGYTKGGQYVQLKAPGTDKGAPIAIASAPSKGTTFEFLVKEQPPSDWSPGTGWLTGASAGAPVDVSQAMGPGFIKSADALEGITDVLCFAVGSGISPLRSTIESGALDGLDVTLYYGCQTPDLMSYQEKFADWEKLGTKVVPVISKADGTGWDGATGYVQDVAKAAGVANPKGTAVLLCGMKGMAEGVKEFAADAGIPEDRVWANF
jgi:NAD(P)H-flavin reductase